MELTDDPIAIEISTRKEAHDNHIWKDIAAPSKLEDLPIELLTHIVDHLTPSNKDLHTPNNIADLHSLCVTSKTLHGVAVPSLYQAFSTEYSTNHLRPLL